MPALSRRSARRVLWRLCTLLVLGGLLIAPVSPALQSVYATSRPLAATGALPLAAPTQEDVVMAQPAPIAQAGTPQTDNGLTILLGEGAEAEQAQSGLPVVTGEPLAAGEAQALLDRAQPISPLAPITESFRLPPASLPPPVAGTTITQTFPPTDTQPVASAPESGPLEVLRFAPQGPIPIAPFLNVTFNQPMVPLATLDQLSAESVPVQLEPAVPGVWKWLGTTTLSFEYRDEELNRFPMATVFTATIPAGTQSATGGELAETVTWTFSTPAPTVQMTYPSSGPQRRDPLMAVAFDQNIDPAAVLQTITAQAGGVSFPLRLATAAEVAADETLSRYLKVQSEGRWLAFKPEQPFPGDTTVTINIGPGTPSAEGPLTSEQVQSFSFQTYGDLRIVKSYCGWEGSNCPPGQPFTVEFNNPLDVALVNNSLITADPAIPGMNVAASYNTLTIYGATAGRTKYTVTVSGAVQDIFGQTLGEDATLTFQTGNADSYLTGPRGPLTTLDPSSRTPVFTVYTMNYDRLRVRAYAVTPEQWTEYLQYLDNFWRDRGQEPPGERVLEQTIDVQGQPDVLTETAIDLSAALGGKPGHLIVVVDKPASLLSLLIPQNDYVVQSWVQVTNIGLDAISDNEQMAAWATRLSDGAALAGVQLQLLPGSTQGTTGADGLARLQLPQSAASILVGRLGEDVAILPRSSYAWDTSGWAAGSAYDELRWLVYDDRGMYRPGEEVHVKGFVRRSGYGPQGDLSLGGLAGAPVTYQVMDPQGNLLTDGALKLSDLGGFSLAFTLPVNSNLGYASIQFLTPDDGSTYNQNYYHSFQVQEFRRPEFEVTARNETTGPYYLGDAAIVAIAAQYYAGGPLPNAAADWTIDATPTSYSPPNWEDFVFGIWTPWWYMGGEVDSFAMSSSYPGFAGAGAGALQYAARTDATGSHYLKLTFIEADEPRPYSVLADGRVMDLNNQAWAANTTLLVHPSELYVGLRSDRTFVQPGEPIDVELIVTDVDGKAVAERPIQVRAVRLDWEFKDGKWQEVEADEQLCEVTSLAEPVKCSFTTDEGGQYRIRAEVRDDQERLNRSEFTRWVSGGQTVPQRDVQQETVVLIPDQEEYQEGETANILVQAPFAPASGLLTLGRDGIVSSEPFTLENGVATLQIPIEASHLPTLHVQVDVNGSAPRLDDQGNPLADAPARPAFATGSLQLNIPPLSRTLAVTATVAADKVDPGSATSLDLQVTDQNGDPVAGAELAVVVVDEAVLALSGYQLADPIAVFYAARGSGLTSIYGRTSILLANPQTMLDEMQNTATIDREGVGGGDAMAAADSMAVEEAAAAYAPAAAPLAAAPMATMAPAMAEAQMTKDESAATTPITVRSDFNPLALFAPDVKTDADGRATVEYTLPDNLTRYRVMVIAATEKQFGSAAANVTARLPLMVRPSAPRFLNFGDRFEFPVVLQNQTDEPLTVDVAIETANLTLEGATGQRVTVPANDRVAVRFPATTADVGTAYAQIVAAAGDYADASQVQLPVYTPATTEAFAVYGTVDEGTVVQPVAQPQNVFPQFGGLEVSTSSTALQSLTDALLYLQTYPFECSEQIAARVMSVAALRDVLTAFRAGGLQPPAEIDAAVARDIELLEQLQNPDGGWPFWTRGEETFVYNSIFVAHALQLALNKDYAVQQETLQAAREFLRNVEAYYQPWYSPEVRQTLSAYALYVRYLMGDLDPAKARQVYAQLPLDDASLEALAWLWQVMGQDPGSAEQVAEIARRINNSAVETAGMANFFSSYGDQEWVMLHSDRRTDAVVLDALITMQPQSDLIAKVVRGLMAARDNGRWGNTQENVWVIAAMDRYFNTFENVEPDFIARVWLGETYVAESEFRGYTTDTFETTVPMSYLTQQAGEQDLIIAKEGEGRLYYRLGLTYAPTDLTLEPLDMGFVVQRTYEAVDDPADVTRDGDGVWHIKEGARVRIRLTMVAVNRRYHVALVDRLPAGLEIINPDLAVAESVPADPSDAGNRSWWWWYTWYNHQNLRDAGAEAFATYLWDGVYDYTYVARATTPGTYVVPPARAEEMYSPEVFGRSGSETVIVE